MAKRPDEIAELRVNGQLFTNWTSVHVENRTDEWFPRFQFECSEFTPMPVSWLAQQFKPGDIVEIMLAGQQAVVGYITERHVGYAAKNHAVRLIGVGKTYDLTNTSVWEQGGSYDGHSWTSFTKAMIAPAGIQLQLVGAVDNAPFENMHVQPGEIVSAAIERYARHRKILIGSTPDGKLLGIGENSAQQSDALVEGQNIKEANCVIRDENVYSKIFATGQAHGDDSNNMDKANKMVAEVAGKSSRNRTLVILSDLSDTQHGLQQRAGMELNFTDGLMVEAHITVQGWLRSNGALWRAGDYYWVKSPMLMLDHLLGCKAVVFDQAEGAGTTTTLEMVDPAHLNGKPDLSVQGFNGSGGN